nr:zinc finger BED domain-containing protein RICESLEEPER 2-like [Ipomoea batatas]
MLSAGFKNKTAFDRMVDEDKLYDSYFQEDENGKRRFGPPLSDDWENVHRLVQFLKIFYDATLAFSSYKNVTSSHCFNNICTIEASLNVFTSSSYVNMSNMAFEMKKKFDKYWEGLEINKLLIISSVFDPRSKMGFVTICFEKLYGKDTTKCIEMKEAVMEVLRKLYESVLITTVDVAGILGLPMGHIEITKRTVTTIPEILKEWSWIFKKTTAYITPNALTMKMLEVDVDDPWFKRHFALLVMRVLIDPMVNGYVNHNYIDHLWDVENISNLNWGQMVINALVSSKLGVVLYIRSVPRSFPAFRSWTFKLLLKREQYELKSGGFGYGHVDSALQLENAPPEEECPSIPQSNVPHPPQPQVETPPPMLEGLQGFVD